VTSIGKVPSSDRWVHEVKFDGYRVQNARCRIFTDPAILDRFNKIANDAFLINAVSAIIGGEVAGPAAEGTDGKRTLCSSEGL
jgi:bifunctional non-homologous end joining protein LigD